MAFDDWKKSFKDRSEKQCRKAFDDVLRAEFGLAMARHAGKSMERFKASGLWSANDEFIVWQCMEGFLALDAKALHGGDLARVSEFGESVENAFAQWKAQRSGPAIASLWAKMEPEMGKALEAKAMLLGGSKATEAFEYLSGGAPWERALAKRLGGARSGDYEVAKYGRCLLSTFKARVAELSAAGMLPGVGQSHLRWGKPARYGACSWNSEYGGAIKADGAEQERLMVLLIAHGEGDGREGPSVEFEFEPAWGPFGVFKMGGFIHTARIRWCGAEEAARADWSRFGQKLAKVHAGMLADAMGRGCPMGLGCFERGLLDQALPSNGSKGGGGAKRL